MSVSQRILEVTDAQRRREFIKQINSLIRNTGKFERDKVDRMIDLLNRARADLQQTILLAGPGEKFTRQTATMLKQEVERLMADFQVRAELQMNAAQQEIADIASDTIDTLARSQGRRPSLLGIKPELIENAQSRTADLIRSLARRNIGRVSDVVNVGVITGKSTFEVGRELATEFNKSLAQMETIARTEMLGVHSQVSFAELQSMAKTSPGLKKQWISVIDFRTRLGHELEAGSGGAHLQSVPVNSPFRVPLTIRGKGGVERLGKKEDLLFPRDPAGSAGNVINCFLPGTEVQGIFIAATRAWYSGEVVRIRTERGFEVAVTPNHPVFTTRRMVPASEVRKGDYLLGYKTGKERGLEDINVDQPPTRIENVFGALAQMRTQRKTAGATDFHGDGQFMKGEIEVVSLQGELLGNLHSPAPKFKSKVVFENPSKKAPGESGSGPGNSRLQGIALAQPRGPCLSALGLDSFLASGSNPPPFQRLSVGTASQINLSCYKSATKSRTANASLVAEGLQGGTAAIPSGDLSDIRNLDGPCPDGNARLGECAADVATSDPELAGQLGDGRPVFPPRCQGRDIGHDDSPVSHGHAALPERPIDGLMVDADFPAKLQDRFPELVLPDKVVDIRYDYFSGHVYDLQSPYGHMVANYTLQKQCRCTMVPDYSEVEPPGLSLVEMPPVRIPLSDLSAEVEKSVKKGFRNLR